MAQLEKSTIRRCKGSWIVITTRSGLVAEITSTVSPHILEGLSKSESWSLLKQMAFKEESRESNDSRLEAIGMEIVEKCKGVPLALRVIGRLLFKRTEAEWLRVKNNVHKYITHQENGILPILKLSYDHLPPHLRQCFAYCSLIPKDTQLHVGQLIRFWMAQGFIQPLSGDGDLEDACHEYFKDLLWRSFFEVAGIDNFGNAESFTMHDLMHDLACSVAWTEYCIASLKAENVNERTRHVSFEDVLDSSWEIPNTLLKATRVRSFIQNRGGSLNLSTLSALMSNFKYLRMLDLSYFDIERLPHSIGKLKHLKALYLCGNGNITTLPSSLSRLQNLQTLDLFCCKRLENLPRKTSRLVSLKHLHIDGCHGLAQMPRGLGQLTCLHTLSKFVVGKTGRRVGQLRELNGLNKLDGKLHISSLQNAISEHGSTYLKDKLNSKFLELNWRSREEDDEDDVINVNDEMVFECLQPHPNLEMLYVNGYPGSKISSWLSSIINLTILNLKYCSKCKHLPPLHQLCSLKVLNLYRLEALENVSEIEMQKEFSSVESSTIFLPSLEELCIEYCPNLKGWWTSDVGEASNAQLPCFPCLSGLSIKGCPNLTSMPLFPSVRKLNLRKTSSKPLQQTMKLKRTTSEAPSSSSSSSIFPPFSKLETLELDEIKDLDSMPLLHQLSSLKDLYLYRLEALENVFEIEMQKELFSTKSTTFLPSLDILEIVDCPNLKGWWRGDVGAASNPQLPCFPCLSDLSIEDCPNLTSIPLFPSVRKLNLRKTSSKPLQQTMKLKRTTSEAPSSSSLSSSIFPPFSKLETLELDEIKDLDSVPSLHQLSCLKVLRLYRLKALENVFEIEKQTELSSVESTTLFFPSLENLIIEDCPNLKGRGRDDVGDASNAQLPCFPCLSYVEIIGSHNLTSMLLFPSVRYLILRKTSWKPLQETIKLKRTTSEAPSSSSSSSSIFPPFSKLKTLSLTKIEDLNSLPEEFLQNLTSLQHLWIESCVNLTSMPEGMQRLTSLKNLRIVKCPQLSERCRRDIVLVWTGLILLTLKTFELITDRFNRGRHGGTFHGFHGYKLKFNLYFTKI